jgi:hypothetical protein
VSSVRAGSVQRFIVNLLFTNSNLWAPDALMLE